MKFQFKCLKIANINKWTLDNTFAVNRGTINWNWHWQQNKASHWLSLEIVNYTDQISTNTPLHTDSPISVSLTNILIHQTRQPLFNLFYTIIIQEQRSNGAWSYWEHKIDIPIPRGSLLISILRSTFAIFYVIPSSNPWLTWCRSGLRRSMLCKVFCDLWFDGRKYLFEHELFSGEAVFPKGQKKCTRSQIQNRIMKMACRTGLEFRSSGGCSWPESHFHKSGFSWEIKQSWN